MRPARAPGHPGRRPHGGPASADRDRGRTRPQLHAVHALLDGDPGRASDPARPASKPRDRDHRGDRRLADRPGGGVAGGARARPPRADRTARRRERARPRHGPRARVHPVRRTADGLRGVGGRHPGVLAATAAGGRGLRPRRRRRAPFDHAGRPPGARDGAGATGGAEDPAGTRRAGARRGRCHGARARCAAGGPRARRARGPARDPGGGAGGPRARPPRGRRGRRRRGGRGAGRGCDGRRGRRRPRGARPAGRDAPRLRRPTRAHRHPGVDQRRGDDARRPARQGRGGRLLDLLVRQLHQDPLPPAPLARHVRRRPGRDRRAHPRVRVRGRSRQRGPRGPRPGRAVAGRPGLAVLDLVGLGQSLLARQVRPRTGRTRALRPLRRGRLRGERAGHPCPPGRGGAGGRAARAGDGGRRGGAVPPAPDARDLPRAPPRAALRDTRSGATSGLATRVPPTPDRTGSAWAASGRCAASGPWRAGTRGCASTSGAAACTSCSDPTQAAAARSWSVWTADRPARSASASTVSTRSRAWTTATPIASTSPLTPGVAGYAFTFGGLG